MNLNGEDDDEEFLLTKSLNESMLRGKLTKNAVSSTSLDLSKNNSFKIINKSFLYYFRNLGVNTSSLSLFYFNI